jgi:CRISP-associated protein Cas1
MLEMVQSGKMKHTISISSPGKLNMQRGQLVLEQAEGTKQVPIEDIGLVLLEDPQISISKALLDALMQAGAGVIVCDDKHLPTGMMLSMDGHTEQAKRYRAQIESSQPLRKQLWQQTIEAKLRNQGAMLDWVGQPQAVDLKAMAKRVRSGDPDNLEGQGAF